MAPALPRTALSQKFPAMIAPMNNAKATKIGRTMLEYEEGLPVMRALSAGSASSATSAVLGACFGGVVGDYPTGPFESQRPTHSGRKRPIAGTRSSAYRFVMRSPKSWPKIVYILWAAVLGASAASIGVSFSSGLAPTYVAWIVVIALALGIALFASRVVWVVSLLLFGWSLFRWARYVALDRPSIFDNVYWPSWINVGLQTLILGILLTPAMFCWIDPLRKRPKASPA